MKKQCKALQNDLTCSAGGTTECKLFLCGMGALGVILLTGVAAALYNSKQMRAARAWKRTGRVLYTLGTAMRSVSGSEAH